MEKKNILVLRALKISLLSKITSRKLLSKIQLNTTEVKALGNGSHNEETFG